MIGAREGRPTWLRRLVAGAAARTPAAFVVPGAEVARARGLDLEGAGLRPVATPRRANVLVLVGDIPPVLAEAAAVAYAQMPRPRAILALGTRTTVPLPVPDVEAGADQAALCDGVDRLRRLLADHAWTRDVAPFDVPAVRPHEDDPPGGMDHGGMHHTAHAAMEHGSGDHTRHDDQVPADDSGEHRPAAEGGIGGGADDDPAGVGMYQPATGHDHSERAGEAHSGHGATGRDSTRQPDEQAQGAGAGGLEGRQHSDMDHGDGRDDSNQHDGHASMTATAESQHGLPGSDELSTGEGGMMGTGDAPGHDVAQAHTEHLRDARVDAAGNHEQHRHTAAGEQGGAGRPDRGETRRAGHAEHDHTGQSGGTVGGDGDMRHGDHAGMGHEMHMGGFMSMVEMTRDLPRSADGLPMEWLDAPFGPLFPGLPGGMALTLTLDGDTAARATLAPGVVARDLGNTWPGPAAGFPDRLAALDPLAPVAYRVLALRALEAAARVAPDEAVLLARIGALERERAASHLNWLAGLGHLLGDALIAQEAGALQLAVLRAPDAAALAGLRPRATALARKIRRSPLLARRLRGVGCLDATVAADLRGPAARASGIARDVRVDDPAYRAAGFVPVVCLGGDALARLAVRLTEIERSLDLVAAVGTIGPVEGAPGMSAEGDGAASIETPRGGATLRLGVRGGVRVVALDTPSAAHAALLPTVSEGRELADALVAVASLDLSPWEIDR